MKWAMAQNQPALTVGAKMVLMVLADAYNQKAQRDPYLSLKTIGQLARIRSNTTLSKHICELEELGLVERRKRPNASNIYVLSGAPDFKLAVQKMDSEVTIEDATAHPVSDARYPVSDVSYPEDGQRMSSIRSRTTKTTNLITKKNHAFEAESFSAEDDKGLEIFLSAFSKEPTSDEEARNQYQAALARGVSAEELIAAAMRQALKVKEGFWEPMDPAEWLRRSRWIELRKLASGYR